MSIRIDKVYTKTGDRGETGLVGGKRVGKDTPRIDAYGTVDELNAWVGIVRSYVRGSKRRGYSEVESRLRRIQNELFDLGSQLATPPDFSVEGMPKIEKRHIRCLEEEMDRYQKSLPPLKSFVLPGGGKVSGFLHLCRTVCRRAERETLRLSKVEPVDSSAMAYLNRLSDFFFVLSRWVGKGLGETEFLWERDLTRSPLHRKKTPSNRGK